MTNVDPFLTNPIELYTMFNKSIMLLVTIGLFFISISCVSTNTQSSSPEIVTNHPIEEVLPLVVQQIRNEGTKSAANEKDRPLPLASSWEEGSYPYRYTANCQGLDRESCSYQFFSPNKQIQLIEDGHHILPVFGVTARNHSMENFGCSSGIISQLPNDYYRAALTQLSEWGLPLTVMSSQWEAQLYSDCRYRNKPISESSILTHTYEVCLAESATDGPSIIETRSRHVILPGSNLNNWYEVGKDFADETQLTLIEYLYPDPPKVIMLSNDESSKMNNDHIRFKPFIPVYVDPNSERDIADPCNETKPAVFSSFYDPYTNDPRYNREYEMSAVNANSLLIQKYTDGFKKFRDGLVNNFDTPTWRDNSTIEFVGYTTYNNNDNGWYVFNFDELYPPGYFETKLQFWEGGAPPYYIEYTKSDHVVQSPQLSSMNQKVMVDYLRQFNPDFWNEMSVSTNFVREEGYDDYTPNRFMGMLQYGMWIMRPRVVREFHGWQFSFAMNERAAYFDKILNAVDVVYENDNLSEFWRRGELLLNKRAVHPFNDSRSINSRFDDVERCYLLECDVNPDMDYLTNNLTAEVKVFALAMQIAEENKPKRWMVYAHAPLGDLNGVEIEIPMGDINNSVRSIYVDVVPQAGRFIFLEEESLEYWVD